MDVTTCWSRRVGFLAVVMAYIVVPAVPAAAQQLPPDSVRSLVEGTRAEALATYRELLTYPNDAHHPEDILRLVAWLEEAFAGRGFTTERLPTPGSPLLLAERPAPDAGRTVLVYLQADGQPVDPAAWDQESPWEPVLKERAGDGSWRTVPWDRVDARLAAGEALDPDWRVFARSAADSKGPVAQFLAAMRLLDRTGAGPAVKLKVIVDTQEEQGSPHLPSAVERFRDRLAADMLVIFDGPPHASGEPTLKFGARGIATATLTVHGPRAPVHSGHYGNYVPNPVFRLAEILAAAKDDAGRVTLPGWYDGVELDGETRELLANVPDDEPAIQRELGIAMIDSVAATLQEAVQYPSLNVRGVRAGWVGDEARTIIPARAVAEIDVRLVKESDPERLLWLLRRHVEDRGYRVLSREPTAEERRRHPRLATLTSTVAYAAFRTPFDSEPGRWLGRALQRHFGQEPIRIRTSGGSIPISPFVTTLDVPAVSVPTVNPDNNQHSPNENLRLAEFFRGIETMLAVLTAPVLPEDAGG
jgi:acetylornithine deacetylase/succinyl-diaminopimelate desuccinylase-like protein